MPEESERRMIVTLSMSRMNKILSINKEDMTVCAEAGIVGINLEE
jgi:FAD/FMN-containing dehydrogenase